MGCFVVVCFFFSFFFNFYFFLTLKLWRSSTLIDHMIYLKCCYILNRALFCLFIFDFGDNFRAEMVWTCAGERYWIYWTKYRDEEDVRNRGRPLRRLLDVVFSKSALMGTF